MMYRAAVGLLAGFLVELFHHHTAVMSTDPLMTSVQNKDGYSAIDLDNRANNLTFPVLFTGQFTESRILKRSNGRSLVKHVGIASRHLGFIKDGFTTLINLKWYWIILVFVAMYLLSWLFFGCVWTAVAYVNGRYNGSCIKNVYDFSTAFLFSVETQTTIGFGNKFVKGACNWGIFVIVLQSLLGLLIDSLLLGLIFAKITRPRNRRKTMAFSKVALIYEKNGQNVLEFRVGDLRHSQMVECHVRLHLYRNKLVDPVNMQYEFEQYDLDVGYDTGRDRIFLLTPISVYHYINESSPLYGITEEEMANIDMEVVVILEGIVEATGLTAQALWSYRKSEIVFNRRFVPMVSRCNGKWEVDFAKLDSTVPVVQPQHQGTEA